MKKSLRVLSALLVSGATLSMAAVQAQQATQPANRGAPGAPAAGGMQRGGAAPAAASPDRDFVEAAAKSGAMEVEASKIAVERADNARVKSFAKMMVSDHSKANDKLKKLAMDKGIDLPDEQAVAPDLAQLKDKSGHDFDMAYMQAAGPDAHQQAVSLFQQEATSGTDAQLRSFAKQTLPTLKKHLKEAESLQSRLAKQ